MLKKIKQKSLLICLVGLVAFTLCSCSSVPKHHAAKTVKTASASQAASAPEASATGAWEKLTTLSTWTHWPRLSSWIPFTKKAHDAVQAQEQQDGPPLFPKSVAHIKDAEPKLEVLSRYGNPATYEVLGKKYKVMKSTKHGHTQKGMASWYGTKFHGRRTSSGEPYDLYSMTAAHKSLPLPTYVKVKNLKNDREVVVKVNDRGPFVSDRIIDLSYAAAKKLGVYDSGTAPVSVTVIDPKHPKYVKAKNKKPSPA